MRGLSATMILVTAMCAPAFADVHHTPEWQNMPKLKVCDARPGEEISVRIQHAHTGEITTITTHANKDGVAIVILSPGYWKILTVTYGGKTLNIQSSPVVKGELGIDC